MVGDSSIGLLFRVKADSSDAEAKLKQLNRTVEAETSGVESKFAGIASSISQSVESETAAAGSHFSNLASSVDGSLETIAGAITSLGTALTAGLTLPLAALGTLGVKAALGLDEVRTKITALVGNSGEANQKIIELYGLADRSVGVFRTGAIETFAQLKGIGGITDETINKVIGSLGKLNAAFKIEDLAGFNQNLNQIFTQGFERADIKEAIGRVPFFEQLLEQAFGTKDGTKLKQLKESGKLTLDSFLSGLSGAIDSDPRIANIQENLSTKLAKTAERLNTALAPIGGVILAVVLPAIEAIVPYLESLFNWFAALSPTFQTVIVAIGGVLAAIGPVLIVIGGVIAAIGSIVSGVVALGGLAVAAKFIGIAILAVIGLFLQFALILGAAAAVAATLYKAWQTNFGGIRDYTLAAWETIKSATSAAMTFIYGIVQTVGGAIVGWWRDNYPLIRATVITVSDAIKGYIGTFLNAVRGFWTSHGAAIMEYVRTYWNVVKGIISTVMSQIGNFIKLAMQLIRGDWSNAWETFKQILTTGTRLLIQIWTGFLRVFWSALKAIIPIVWEYGSKIYTTLLTWVGKAVVGVGYIFATLPYQLLKIIPALYKAGLDIAASIWQGIKEGLGLAAAQNPVTIPVSASTADIVIKDNLSGDFTENQTQTTTGGGGGGGGDDEKAEKAEKRRKEQEEILKRNLAAQVQLLQGQLQEAQSKFDKTFSELKEDFQQTGNLDLFKQKFTEAVDLWRNETNKIAGELEQAEKEQAVTAQAVTEKKTPVEWQVFEQSRLKRRQELSEKYYETQKEMRDIERKAQKDAADKEVIQEKEKLQRNLALQESQAKTFLANQKKNLDEGRISERQYIQFRQVEENDLLQTKKKNLQTELKLVAGNVDEEKRIKHEILLLDEEITQKTLANATEVAEFIKKEDERRKQALQELAAIRREEIEAERQILDFRAAQIRKSLENAVESQTGKAKIKALLDLQDFEIAEEYRKEKQRVDDLEAEKTAALERIEGKENEEAQKKAIEDLYKKRAEQTEEEFQIRLKEIRDSFKPKNEEAGSGFLGVIIKGFGEYLTNVVLVQDANGQLRFSFQKMFESIGKMGLDAFGALAQGFGQMVSSWVLYGNTGGMTLRKLAAQILSNLAGVAAQYAIMCLAAAALATTVWGAALLGGTPGQFLIAAALFGAIAIGAAIAGRALAGDSFKNNNSASAALNGQPNQGANQTQTGGQNRLAATEEALRIIAEDRANPSRNELLIKVQSNDSHILDVLESDVSNNGRSRGMFIKLAEVV